MYPARPAEAAYISTLGFGEDLKDGFEETVVYSSSDERGYYEVNVKGIYGSAACRDMRAVSTDKKVAAVKYSPPHRCFILMPKKPGTTEVTFSAKKKGKRIVRRGTFKVVGFKDPFKNLKINGKDYAKKVKTAHAFVEIEQKKTSVTFEYSLQPGWKVERTYGRITGEEIPWEIYTCL